MKTYDEVQDAVDGLRDLICCSKSDGEQVAIYISFGTGDGYCRYVTFKFIPEKGITGTDRKTMVSSLDEFHDSMRDEAYEVLTQVSPLIEEEIMKLILSSQIGDVPRRRAVVM